MSRPAARGRSGAARRVPRSPRAVAQEEAARAARPNPVLGVLVLAVVLTVFLLGDPRSSGPEPDSQPRAATVEDFCSAFAAMETAYGAASDAPDPVSVGELRSAAGRARDVAARTADLPPEALAGLAFVTDLFAQLPDDATRRQLRSSGRTPTLVEEARAKDLVDFLAKHCTSPSDS